MHALNEKRKQANKLPQQPLNKSVFYESQKSVQVDEITDETIEFNNILIDDLRPVRTNLTRKIPSSIHKND